LIEGKTIFITVLDWGLGHATRCVPIIRELSRKNKIVLGVSDLTKLVFNAEFPSVQKIEVQGYDIRYSSVLPAWLKLLFVWPRIAGVIKREKIQLEKIISEHDIDLVISDSRFGFYSKRIHSILITHQLSLHTPTILNFSNIVNRKFISNFNEVWVPDYADPKQRLAGGLSFDGKIGIPVKYIGPKSAMVEAQSTKEKRNIDILILLSGPEPQRSILEEILLEKFKDCRKNIELVRGTIKARNKKYSDIIIHDFLKGKDLKSLITSARLIICRSGYSTLMDLHLLGKKNLILIPTPGQTEQEYLAQHWSVHFGARTLPQREIKSIDPEDFIAEKKGADARG
jgi:uncharacterized protein (TIGR00661 family)